MNNKHLLYLLLAIVIGVWLKISLNIAMLFDSTDNAVQPTSNNNHSLDSSAFTLSEYADPFNRFEVPVKPTKVNGPKLIQKRKDTLQWPEIIYKGLITNDAGKAMAFVSVSGKVGLVASGETIEGIKVINANNNRLLVQLEGKKKLFDKVK